MDIDARTQFCGVIGNPVGHSLSPAIHNAAFRKLGLNFVYLAWQVEAIGEAIKGLRALGNFRGASVTIPHKVAAIPFLDHVEQTAQRIGAINTIVAEKGELTGYNTDATGALRALREGGVELKERRIVVLGSGGAARAIAFALAAESGAEKLTLLGIEDAERTRLAQDIRSTTAVTVEDSSSGRVHPSSGSSCCAHTHSLHSGRDVSESRGHLRSCLAPPSRSSCHGHCLQSTRDSIAQRCRTCGLQDNFWVGNVPQSGSCAI